MTVPGAHPILRDFPQFLDAERVELRQTAPASSPRRRTSVFVRLPRTPSQKIVTFARMSTPGSNVDLRSPCLSMPRSPVRTPTTWSPVVEHLRRRESAEDVDAGGFDLPGQPLHELVERDDVVAVIPERRRRDRETAACRCASGSRRRRAGRPRASGAPFAAKSGIRSRSVDGSRTAPDSMCAPASRAFSSTAIASGSPPRSFCSCASRSAADIPAGPPPTIRTSTSRVSRSAMIQSRDSHSQERKQERREREKSFWEDKNYSPSPVLLFALLRSESRPKRGLTSSGVPRSSPARPRTGRRRCRSRRPRRSARRDPC